MHDRFCRAVMYPSAPFHDGVLDETALLDFRKVQSNPRIYRLSVGWQFMLGSTAAAHLFGKKVTEVANDRLRISAGDAWDAKSERYYVGFYDITFAALKGDPFAYYRVEILHAPEHGLAEHFNIDLVPRHDASNRQRSNDRADGKVILAAQLIGPRRKVFAEDEDVIATLEGLKLPDLPAANDP